jgi:hypothetical protein
VTTTLYRAYDARDRLLYVGISDGEFIRLAQHAASAPWTMYAATITLKRYVRRADAEQAERAAILDEDPVWNVKGRPLARFYQWMAAYPDGDPDAVDALELVQRAQQRLRT